MRNSRFAAGLASIALLPGYCLPAAAEPAASWPARVDAHYSLQFTGLGEVGTFRYRSQFQGNDYTMTGNAEVKVPLIYKWSSSISGSGTLVGDEPRPATYLFSSQGKPVIGGAKRLSVRLGLKDRAVTQVNIVPPHNPGGAHYVPVKPEHLQSVIDPLTAVLTMTHARGGSPCGRRMAIFDGKQRFDLLTSPAGQQKVAEARPSGQPAIGYLCKVRYIPVGGFKDTEDFRSMINNSSAEIALRPVPSANLLVPYRITVSTKWGTGTMVLRRMDIEAPGQKQIALVH